MYDSKGETNVKLIDNDSVICDMVGCITNTDEHVVSLGDCEAAVDEEEEDSEFVDSDYAFSEYEEAKKGCNVDINMPCDEEVNVETATQRPVEISYDRAYSDTLYSDGNTSDNENSSQHVTKNRGFAYQSSSNIGEIDKEESTFVVKAIHANHTCGRVDRLRYANSTWISQRFCDKMRRNPNWNVGNFKMSNFPPSPPPPHTATWGGTGPVRTSSLPSSILDWSQPLSAVVVAGNSHEMKLF
ncbi:hypothetical protein L3X38_033881 [Prunus dulcis]|uniref:Uncharacterized protein n=1 Tax=Prunus dulcis TaxID=3755 RepID=A0AAD4VI36_PRUDU|nr:hypothetical protein L3X38_033881 [Prunus dulcis]